MWLLRCPSGKLGQIFPFRKFQCPTPPPPWSFQCLPWGRGCYGYFLELLYMYTMRNSTRRAIAHTSVHAWRTRGVRLATRLKCNKFSIFLFTSWFQNWMSEINFMRTAPSILLCSLKTLIHDMFLFVRQPIRFKQSHGSVRSDFKWDVIETFYSLLYPNSACRWRFAPTLWQLCFPVTLLNHGIEGG